MRDKAILPMLHPAGKFIVCGNLDSFHNYYQSPWNPLPWPKALKSRLKSHEKNKKFPSDVRYLYLRFNWLPGRLVGPLSRAIHINS